MSGMQWALAISVSSNLVLGIVTLTKSRPKNPIVERIEIIRNDPTTMPQRTLASVPTPIRAPATVKTADAACEKFWTALKKVRISDDATSLPKIPSGKACTSPPQKLSSFHADYVNRCENLEPSNLSPSQGTFLGDPTLLDCRFVIRGYLANLVAWETKDLKASDINDPRVLKQRLRAALEPAAGVELEPQVIIDTAHRLLELSPRNLEAAKQVLFGVTFLREGTEETRNRTDIWEKADFALQRAEALSTANDPEIEEYGLWIRTRALQPDLIRAEAQKHSERYAGSGLGFYYLAGVEWQNNNESLAKKYLSQALKIEPRERRFRETSKQIEKGEMPWFDFRAFSQLNHDALAFTDNETN